MAQIQPVYHQIAGLTMCYIALYMQVLHSKHTCMTCKLQNKHGLHVSNTILAQ